MMRRPEVSSLANAPLDALEAAAQYAADASDEISRDEAVNFALGACGRALGRCDSQVVLPAARIAARVSTLASGRHRLPMLSEVVDAVVSWALDPRFHRRPSLGLVEALAGFGENAWIAERDMTESLVANLDADLRALADAATDDVSAGRAADLARCLAAIARNAPYAVARGRRDDENVASRCIASLVTTRRVVSDLEAWDNLTIELSASVTRGLSVQDCWPLPYCLVAKCVLGSALLALKGVVGSSNGDAQAKAARRLRKRVETYRDWQLVWLSPQNDSSHDAAAEDVERFKAEARRKVFISTLSAQQHGDKEEQVLALGRLASSLYHELLGVVTDAPRVKNRRGTGGSVEDNEDEDDVDEKPVKYSRSWSSSRSTSAGGRKAQKRKPRLSEADEASVVAALDALNAAMAELVSGHRETIALLAKASSEIDDFQKYSWIVELVLAAPLADSANAVGDDFLNSSHKNVLLKFLVGIAPEPTASRCWLIWLRKVATVASHGEQEFLDRALTLTLSTAADGTKNEGALLTTASALQAAGGSLGFADVSQAVRCFDNLAKLTMQSLRTEECVTAASCLTRLLEAPMPMAVADSACDAALEAARALGGGRPLLITREELLDSASLLVSSARALILAAMRLGRAVPRRPLKGETTAVPFLVGASGRSLPLGSFRSRRIVNASLSTVRRTSTKFSTPREENVDEPWPLDSPIWTETVSPLYASNAGDVSHEDAAAALLGCFLSSEASSKLASAATSAPSVATTDPALDTTVTKSPPTASAQKPTPPETPAVSISKSAPAEEQMPSVVLPTGASTTRGGAVSRKSNDPGKKMLVLRRESTTEAERQQGPASAPSTQGKAVVLPSKPTASVTTKAKKHRELFSRMAPAEIFARAVARYAVGAKLKTRLGGAAATLGMLRSEINNTSAGSAGIVALAVAFEQEITAASELPPRSHTNQPTNADHVPAFGTVALKPSLAVAAFFRQNRAVCDEWLKSIRISAAELAIKHRLFADAAHHADAACLSAKDDTDYVRSVALGALACVALGDEYAIRASFEEATANRAGDTSSFWWLQAAADVACGRYELALSELLRRGIASTEPAVVQLCVDLIARCLAAVGDGGTEADFAGRLAAKRREASDDEALLAALAPRRSVLALERWACPPDDGGDDQRQKWSRIESFDVTAALNRDSKVEDDILQFLVLSNSAVSDDAALFDVSRKLRSSPALFDDLSRIFDVGRLGALANRPEELIDGTVDPARRTDLYAAAAVAARKANCAQTAERFVDAALVSAAACADAPRRLGAPVFAALERNRLQPEPTAESLGIALSAAETAYFSTTINEFTGEAAKSPLFKSTAQWLAEALEHVAPLASSSESLAGLVRRVVQKLESVDVSRVEGNTLGMCLATAAALSPSSAKRWITLAEWHEARRDSSSAKRAFARALATGPAISTRLCASRALRLISTSSEDEGDAAQWQETPVRVWEGVAPQLLAECYKTSGRRQVDGSGVQESVAFKLLHRVALASPRIVVHAVVVGIREGRRGQQQLTASQQDESGSALRLSASDEDTVSREENTVQTVSNRLAEESDDDDFVVEDEDEDDEVDVAVEDDEESPEAKRKLVVLSQKKRAAAGLLGGSDEWVRGAVHMRALRAEMALSGAETRKLLRATELLVDELKSIARLPEDRWRHVLHSSSLTRIGDLSNVRALAGYYDLAGPDAAEVSDRTAADVAAREIVAFRSRTIAAPARHHLERAARDLLPSLEEPNSESLSRPYDRTFAARVRPLIWGVVEELKTVDELSRGKKRGGTFERKFDEAWHVAIESLRHLRDNVVVGEWIGSELSPALSSLSEEADDVFLPVVRSPSNESTSFCRVVKVNDRVSALSSKTRPKKVSFECEDTNRSFLLKGAEDVHLDQRIMQLLDVVNDVLRRKAAHGRPPPLVATYAVLPLSRNSGLIEWVPRTRTLFSLFNDEMTSKIITSAIAERHKQAKKGGGGSSLGLDPALVAAEPEKYAFRYDALPRSFYLEIEKLDSSLSRKPRASWPHETLRAAYDNLSADAPTRFVERELWRGSRDAADWLKRRRNYSAKLGASSVSAFALGLGDRHLENVLFDDHDGSIVDVDWGVCFDAGALLRVPECVPFRLTPAIVAPLQRGGLRDGDFVRSARSLLSALRVDQPGGAAFLNLLELCTTDVRVEWRATLGGLAARQRHDFKSKRRAAPHVTATTASRATSAADEKNAAALALAAARCLGSSMLTAAVENRGTCLRGIISKLDALANAPLSTQFATIDNEREKAALMSAVEQKQAELRIFVARKNAADIARTDAQAKIFFELDRAARRREERQNVLRSLLIGSATDSFVAELRSRAQALTAETPLMDITALRDGENILNQGARLAHYAVRKLRRLTFEQKRQRRQLNIERDSNTSAGKQHSSGTDQGSFFSTDMFGVQRGSGVSTSSPWGGLESTADHLRRKQGMATDDDTLTPLGVVDSEETRLVGRLADEIDADGGIVLDPRLPRAMHDLADAVEKFAPFVVVDDSESFPDRKTQEEEAYRVERAAVMARYRRRRVEENLKKFDECRPRAAATLSVCRGRARRAIRDGVPSITCVDTLVRDLSLSSRLDSNDGSHLSQRSQATALAHAQRTISRLLFLEQQQQHVLGERQSPESVFQKGGAIGDALRCLSFAADADLADAVGSLSLSSAQMVCQTVSRLEAIRETVVGLGVVVEVVSSSHSFQRANDDIPEIKGLKDGLESLSRCADAASKMARDASRLLATSLFNKPTDATSTEWRRRVVELNRSKPGQITWGDLTVSNDSPTDLNVFRALEKLLRPVQEFLVGASDALKPVVSSVYATADLAKNFEVAKLEAALAVLGSRHDALLNISRSGRRLEVLRHGDQAEGDCAYAVCAALRRAFGQPIEALLEDAIERIRSLVVRHRGTGGAAFAGSYSSSFSDDSEQSIILGCLSLSAAAQMAARLDRADELDAVTRLHHHLSRRERRANDTATARACAMVRSVEDSHLETHQSDFDALSARVSFDDEDLVLTTGRREDDDDGQLATIEADRRATLKRIGLLRVHNAARDRSILATNLAKAYASLDDVGDAFLVGLDRRAARRAVVAATLAHVGATQSAAVGGDNYVVWLRESDAHFYASDLLSRWLSEARLLARVATQSQSISDVHEERSSLGDAYDRADAEVVAATTLYDAGVAALERAEKALSESRDNRLRAARARDAVREFPATFKEYLYCEERPYRAKRRRGSRKGQQQHSEAKSTSPDPPSSVLPKKFGGWAELAERCREFASHAVSRPPAPHSNAPPGILSPSPLERRHKEIDIRAEATRLARRFEDLDRLDQTLHELVKEAEPLQALARATDAERFVPPGTKNRVLDDAAKFSRKARKADYCTTFLRHQQTLAEAGPLQKVQPPFVRKTLQGVLGDESYTRKLVLRVLGIARASCRAASAVLDIVDVENVPRFDDVRDSDSDDDTFLDGDDNDTRTKIAPTSAPPNDAIARPFSRVDAAKRALSAATKRLDGTREGSVEDQLASLLHTATDPDVLCRMYEGWAPWV